MSLDEKAMASVRFKSLLADLATQAEALLAESEKPKEMTDEEETREILSDPRTMEALRRAQEQRKRGELLEDSAVRGLKEPPADGVEAILTDMHDLLYKNWAYGGASLDLYGMNLRCAEALRLYRIEKASAPTKEWAVQMQRRCNEAERERDLKARQHIEMRVLFEAATVECDALKAKLDAILAPRGTNG